jgi:hypothetical protein
LPLIEFANVAIVTLLLRTELARVATVTLFPFKLFTIVDTVTLLLFAEFTTARPDCIDDKVVAYRDLYSASDV